jgi:hypothetical protein
MSSPDAGGIFGPIERLSGVIQLDDLLEARFENDVDGNPIYIGYSMIPNADVDDPVWYILKIEYVSQAVVRKRIPDDGRQLNYIWSQRATYFT